MLQIPWKDSVKYSPYMVIPVAQPLSGAIVIGQQYILYHNGSTYRNVSAAKKFT
jgi:DNA damage-binding protein 1